MFAFKFNKTNSNPVLVKELFRLFKVSTRPAIPPAEEIVNEISLGNGTKLYEHTGIYSDRKIELNCNFVSENKNNWIDYLSEIQRALLGDTGTLELTDDESHYWNVKSVTIDSIDRIIGKCGEFDITFVCEPYRYLKAYTTPLQFDISTSGKTVEIYNDKEVTKPMFRFFKNTDEDVTISIVKEDKLFEISHAFQDWITSKDVTYIDLDVENMQLVKHFEDGTYDYFDDDVSGAYADVQIDQGVNQYRITTSADTIKTYLYRRMREL